MSDQSVSKKIIRDFIVSNFLFKDTQIQISDDDSLLSKGIIDSTGIQELVQFLEVTFHIRVLDEEIIPENIETISNIVRFITNKS